MWYALKAKYQQVAQQQGANSAQASRLRQEYSKQANSLNYLENELEQTRNKYREMIALVKAQSVVWVLHSQN